MDKQAIKLKIRQYLIAQHDVLFAYIFGSFAESDKYRDIDIAVYFEPEIELLEVAAL